MKKLAVAVLFVACCAHQKPIDSAENPVLQVSAQEACAKLTRSIKANVVVMRQQMAQSRDVLKPTAEIVKMQCRGMQLVADVLFSAVIDEQLRQTIVVIRLTLLPDGSIEGDVLGSREPE